MRGGSLEEFLSRLRHLDEERGWVEARALLGGELLEALDDRLGAEGVGVRAQASAERRETGAEDHREVELRGARDDAFGQAVGGFIDHRKDEPLLDFGRRKILRRGRDTQLAIHRLVRSAAPVLFIEIKSLLRLP